MTAPRFGSAKCSTQIDARWLAYMFSLTGLYKYSSWEAYEAWYTNLGKIAR